MKVFAFLSFAFIVGLVFAYMLGKLVMMGCDEPILAWVVGGIYMVFWGGNILATAHDMIYLEVLTNESAENLADEFKMR